MPERKSNLKGPSLPVVTTLAEDIEHLTICLKCVAQAAADENLGELDPQVCQLQYNVALFWAKWRVL